MGGAIAEGEKDIRTARFTYFPATGPCHRTTAHFEDIIAAATSHAYHSYPAPMSNVTREWTTYAADIEERKLPLSRLGQVIRYRQRRMARVRASFTPQIH